MNKQINLTEVRQLLQAGAQLVEVLPQAEYENEHLPGAVNIPLKKAEFRNSSRVGAQ